MPDAEDDRSIRSDDSVWRRQRSCTGQVTPNIRSTADLRHVRRNPTVCTVPVRERPELFAFSRLSGQDVNVLYLFGADHTVSIDSIGKVLLSDDFISSHPVLPRRQSPKSQCFLAGSDPSFWTRNVQPVIVCALCFPFVRFLTLSSRHI